MRGRGGDQRDEQSDRLGPLREFGHRTMLKRPPSDVNETQHGRMCPPGGPPSVMGLRIPPGCCNEELTGGIPNEGNLDKYARSPGSSGPNKERVETAAKARS